MCENSSNRMYGLILMVKGDEMFMCNGVLNQPPHLNMWHDRFMTALQLEKEGYAPKVMLYTNDKEIYYKSLLRARLCELTLVCQYHHKHIERLKRTSSAGIIEETLKLQADYQNTLCFKIGRLYNRIYNWFDPDYPIIDERIPWCVQVCETERERRRKAIIENHKTYRLDYNAYL